MKNKKYFCDFYYDFYGKYQLPLSVLIVVVTSILFVYATKWISNKEYREYQDSLSAQEYVYDEDGYKALEEAIDAYVNQDGTVDIKSLREITNGKCQIFEGENDFIILCSLDSETRVKARISNDFKTVTKERIQTTIEDRLKDKYKEIYNNNSSKLIWVWVGVNIAIFATLGISSKVSNRRKQKAQSAQ